MQVIEFKHNSRGKHSASLVTSHSTRLSNSRFCSMFLFQQHNKLFPRQTRRWREFLSCYLLCTYCVHSAGDGKHTAALFTPGNSWLLWSHQSCNHPRGDLGEWDVNQVCLPAPWGTSDGGLIGCGSQSATVCVAPAQGFNQWLSGRWGSLPF